MPKKDKPLKLENVSKVIVSQLADGRAVVSIHGLEATQHFLAQTLLLSKRSRKAALIK